MANKYDGVIEAVHYNPEGQIEWVRAYLRRGPTFSDVVLVERQTLIEFIKAGKKFFTGKRVPQMASTFEVASPVKVVEKDGRELIITGEKQAGQDCLEGVPII